MSQRPFVIAMKKSDPAKPGTLLMGRTYGDHRKLEHALHDIPIVTAKNGVHPIHLGIFENGLLVAQHPFPIPR